jgi:hypothetical protein
MVDRRRMGMRMGMRAGIVATVVALTVAGCGSSAPKAKVADDGSVTLSGSFCQMLGQFKDLGASSNDDIEAVDEDTDPAGKAHAVERALTTSVDALRQLEAAAPDDIRADVAKIHLKWSRTAARVAAVDADDPDQVAGAINAMPVDQVVEGVDEANVDFAKYATDTCGIDITSG